MVICWCVNGMLEMLEESWVLCADETFMNNKSWSDILIYSSEFMLRHWSKLLVYANEDTPRLLHHLSLLKTVYAPSIYNYI